VGPADLKRKELLTGQPRIPKPLAKLFGGVFHPILIVEGEKLLVFRFRGVIRTHPILQGVIRTFSFVFSPSLGVSRSG
jgi:hypothetical protein